jgi:RsiW-degrading membrane proteinase PrsW (M82 family)
MIVLAALLLLCGMCSALSYVVLPFTRQIRGSPIETNVALGALAGLGIVLGAALLWQGIGTLAGRGLLNAASVFPPLFIFVILFFVSLLLGLGALFIQNVLRGAQGATVTALVFPPWHVIAASIPPIALLAYAAHRLGATSGLRALLVSMSWGALGATALGIVIEILIAAGIVVVAAVAISLGPNSQQLIQQLQSQLAFARATGDYSALSGWMNNPAVLAVVLLYAAVLIPFVEEALKTVVVAFIDPRRTRLADALLWGMGAGAGFAVFENLFNGSAALSIWALTIILRIGATIMHVANGATMGRGWYAARVEGRWSRLLIAYVVSVFFHAAWNGAALILSSSVTFLLDSQSAATPMTLPAAGLVAALFIVLLILASLGWVWIVYAVRSAQTSLQPERTERSS